MKKLAVTALVLTLVSLIWAKLWAIDYSSSPGTMGAIFSLREILGLSVALRALEPLIDQPRRAEDREWIPRALAGVMVGVLERTFRHCREVRSRGLRIRTSGVAIVAIATWGALKVVAGRLRGGGYVAIAAERVRGMERVLVVEAAQALGCQARCDLVRPL